MRIVGLFALHLSLVVPGPRGRKGLCREHICQHLRAAAAEPGSTGREILSVFASYRPLSVRWAVCIECQVAWQGLSSSAASSRERWRWRRRRRKPCHPSLVVRGPCWQILPSRLRNSSHAICKRKEERGVIPYFFSVGVFLLFLCTFCRPREVIPRRGAALADDGRITWR